MNLTKFVLRITWTSFVVAMYSLFRSDSYDTNEQIQEKLTELLFLSAFHFVTELSSIITKTEYGCLEAAILKLWYLAWYIGSSIVLIKNQKLDDLSSNVIFVHLIVYTLIFITHIFALIQYYREHNSTSNNSTNENNDLKRALVNDTSSNP
jgi:hypothetical protein